MEGNYIVSARKYRPSTFASVVGQKALTTTLRNSISQNKLAHAYLFTGSRGVGKTSCARIFAKTINCQHRTPEGEACNECDSCREFNRGISLNIVELDAASNNGVDAMHDLIQQVHVPPVNAQYRVFIVDECTCCRHRLSMPFSRRLRSRRHMSSSSLQQPRNTRLSRLSCRDARSMISAASPYRI